MLECDYNPVLEFINEPITLEDKLKRIAWNINKYASYLEYDSKNKEFIKHVYAFKQTKKKWYCQEVYRESESGIAFGKNYFFESYGMANGMRTIWEDCKTFYLNCYEENFEKFDKPDNNADKFYCFQLTTLEDIIANDISLKYCKWDGTIDAFQYIKIYRKYPIAEMLMELNLSSLALNQKCLDYMTNNKSFCKWLYQHKDKINHISFQILKQSFLKGKDPEQYNKELSSKKTLARELSSEIGSNSYKLVKKHIFTEKALNYIKKVGYRNYGDYIAAANYFKLDFNDTKVLFPNNFKHWHDYYTKSMITSQNATIDKGIAKQATKYKCLAQNIDDMTLIFPTKTQDFIDEGEALHHCVGTMKYNERMAKGESLILFVRRTNEIEKPLYTLEFCPKDKSIRQFYGDHDTVPEEHANDVIYNKWLPLAEQLLNKKSKVYLGAV